MMSFNIKPKDHTKVPLRVVKWLDYQTVTLLSSYALARPIGQWSRYDKNAKQSIKIYSPQTSEHYKKHIGGIDTAGANLTSSRIRNIACCFITHISFIVLIVLLRILDHFIAGIMKTVVSLLIWWIF